MSFEMLQGRLVARIFHVQAKTFPGNVLAFVYRDASADGWTMYYRFRYYVDDKVGVESKDKRTEYEVRSRDRDLPDCLPKFREPLACFAEIQGSTLEEVIVDSADPEVVMRRLGEQPWSHISVEALS